MTDISASTAITSAVKYWEPRRLLYNAVLLVVVVANYYNRTPGLRSPLTFATFEGMFVLAVIANVAYCAAYLPDVFMQLSQVRETWLRFRWSLLVVGLGFAAVLANTISHEVFSGV